MEPLTVIVDTSVFVHNMHERHALVDYKSPHYQGIIKAQINYLISGDWLGDLKPEKIKFIFVIDQKDSNLKYWRHYYLMIPEVIMEVSRRKKADEFKRLEFRSLVFKRDLEGLDEDETIKFNILYDALVISYKGGRKHPEYSYTKLRDITYKYIKDLGFPLLGKVGYEADDMAAATVVLNNELETPNRLMLLTMDSDWLGLVNPHTSWFCMVGWYPRLRGDLYTVNLWAGKRLETTFADFKDIWVTKGEKGDKSDNIPASSGVLMPVIDLLNPPIQHRLWFDTQIRRDVLHYLKREDYRTIDGSAAARYLGLNGIAIACRPLDNNKDF